MVPSAAIRFRVVSPDHQKCVVRLLPENVSNMTVETLAQCCVSTTTFHNEEIAAWYSGSGALECPSGSSRLGDI